MPPYEAPTQACELDRCQAVEHVTQHVGLVVGADAGKDARPASDRCCRGCRRGSRCRAPGYRSVSSAQARSDDLAPPAELRPASSQTHAPGGNAAHRRRRPGAAAPVQAPGDGERRDAPAVRAARARPRARARRRARPLRATADRRCGQPAMTVSGAAADMEHGDLQQRPCGRTVSSLPGSAAWTVAAAETPRARAASRQLICRRTDVPVELAPFRTVGSRRLPRRRWASPSAGLDERRAVYVKGARRAITDRTAASAWHRLRICVIMY